MGQAGQVTLDWRMLGPKVQDQGADKNMLGMLSHTWLLGCQEQTCLK